MFKLNIAFGYILRDTNTGIYEYWHTSPNSHTFFDKALLIRDEGDFRKFLNLFFQIDPYEMLLRPEYYIKFVRLTNVTVYIYKLPNTPLGGFACGCSLPKYILKDRSILTFNQYKDNLCLFRCIAKAYINDGKNTALPLNRLTKFLKKKALIYFKGAMPQISLENIYIFEKIFQYNISIYGKEENGGCYSVYNHKKIAKWGYVRLQLIFCSQHNAAHLSYIRNWKMFSKIYQCAICDKVFNAAKNLKQHHKASCSFQPLNIYKKVFYNVKKNDPVFELERSYECFLKKDIVNPFFCVYDFESILLTETINIGLCHDKKTPTTIFSQKHEPVSVSIFSNVPGFNVEPKFILRNGDMQIFINEFVDYLEMISDKAYTLLENEKNAVIENIKANLKDNVNTIKIKLLAKILNIYRILPTISFNGSNYDLNIIKNQLFKRIKKPHCLKRGNSYLCIETKKLKFLDIAKYLQTGTSYSEFLKAFNASQQKGFFPYSWLTNIDKLKQTFLPSKDYFFNDLTNKDISEEDYNSCIRIWNNFNMQTMKDYLKYYNNLDTVPFVESIQTMVNLYKKRGVHIFRDAISLPGVSLHISFSKTTDPYLSAYNEDQHKIISQAIIGGPAVIFCRLAEAGITRIKSHKYKKGHICSTIKGFDSNSLYLHCQSLPQPSGLFSHRVLDGEYLVPTKKYRIYTREILWLLCMEVLLGVKLITSLSPGGQQRVAQKYYVDGYYRDPETGKRIILEYNGCWAHQCPCNLVYDAKKYNEALERLQILKNLPDVTLYSIWDHGYNDFMNSKLGNLNMTCMEYIYSILPKSLVQNRKIKPSKLLKYIENDKAFGLIKCSVYIDPNFASYYDDFPPIFKLAEIGRDHLSGHMKNYVLNNNLLPTPQKMLISTMFAENHVFISPQIRWFNQQNKFHKSDVFRIFNITDFLQFVPKKSFEPFKNEIIKDRIAGDIDPSQKISSLVSKLTGNACYGKTIQNRSKLHKINYVSTDEALKLINSPFFVDMTELNTNLYEVKSQHKKVYWDLPRQIGVFVYGYAKLWMCEFFYNFIKKYLDDQLYELLQMDTDSLYICLGYETIEECVIPELRNEFDSVKFDWLVDPNCPVSKRTGGLFKEEFSGTKYCGLNSKTYFCQGYDKKMTKLAVKVYIKLLMNLILMYIKMY